MVYASRGSDGLEKKRKKYLIARIFQTSIVSCGRYTTVRLDLSFSLSLSSSQRCHAPRAASVVVLESAIGSDPARCRFKAMHGVLRRSLGFSPCLTHGRDK
ncbi:hypothetical protein PUN28_016064 [Cardiocondyla obscurior]|uniref:Uncharacterized protein n=1 Tax=Cardiocondyla obscurior TaxID=286306 RepID=A0AAW2ETD4_9HYME